MRANPLKKIKRSEAKKAGEVLVLCVLFLGAAGMILAAQSAANKTEARVLHETPESIAMRLAPFFYFIALGSLVAAYLIESGNRPKNQFRETRGKKPEKSSLR